MFDEGAMRRGRWRCAGWIAGGACVAAVVVWLGGATGGSLTRLVLLVGAALVVCGGAVAWAAGRGAQAALMAGSVVLSLLGAEAILQWTMPDNDYDAAMRRLYEPDGELGWRFRPLAEGKLVQPEGDYRNRVRIGSRGFRDRESSEGDAARRRVLVLGDSFVANLGVGLDEAFTSRLEVLLGTGWVVGNRGVNGYGQVQELKLLERLLAEERPEWVLVVVFPLNDLADNLGTLDWLQGYGRPWARIEEGGLRMHEDFDETTVGAGRGVRWLASSRLYELGRRMVRRWFPYGVPGYRRAPELEFFRRRATREQDEGYAVLAELLRRMSELCREHNARLGVVVAPCDWQVDEVRWKELVEVWSLDGSAYDRRLPYERIESICASMAVPCLDLGPMLERQLEMGDELYYPHDKHWTPAGNAIVAGALGEWIEEMAKGDEAAMRGE